ncbi:hypothetical protein Tco_1383468 [Tanacetum coccineum]
MCPFSQAIGYLYEVCSECLISIRFWASKSQQQASLVLVICNPVEVKRLDVFGSRCIRLLGFLILDRLLGQATTQSHLPRIKSAVCVQDIKEEIFKFLEQLTKMLTLLSDGLDQAVARNHPPCAQGWFPEESNVFFQSLNPALVLLAWAQGNGQARASCDFSGTDKGMLFL